MHHVEHKAAAAHCWWQHAQSFNLVNEGLSELVGVDVN